MPEYEPESALVSYARETERLTALTEFLKSDLVLPKRDGRITQQSLVDHQATVDEVLEAIRRIAKQS